MGRQSIREFASSSMRSPGLPEQTPCVKPRAKNAVASIDVGDRLDGHGNVGARPRRRTEYLEVAVLVTDGELSVVAEGPNLVVHQSDEAARAAMDEWNTKHHGQSGLTQACARVDGRARRRSASAAILDFLSVSTPQKKKAPLAGNSIHQDRRFVARYLTRSRGLASLPQRGRIDDQGARPTLVSDGVRSATERRREAIRAMDDLLESIAELQILPRRSCSCPSRVMRVRGCSSLGVLHRLRRARPGVVRRPPEAIVRARTPSLARSWMDATGKPISLEDVDGGACVHSEGRLRR